MVGTPEGGNNSFRPRSEVLYKNSDRDKKSLLSISVLVMMRKLYPINRSISKEKKGRHSRAHLYYKYFLYRQ